MKSLHQLETIILLMLENRSFDTMLGWLYQDPADPDAPPRPHRFLPAGSPPTIDGIPPGSSNERGSKAYAPERGTQRFEQPLRVPRWDPHEGLENVHRQLYGDREGWGVDAPMSGFASNFPHRSAAGEVMGAYTRDQLPVLYGLAESFAVSDRWFSSVPTMTDPNRAFSLCGTSLGNTIDKPWMRYHCPTIFGALSGQTATTEPSYGNARKSWGIYWQNRDWVLHPGLSDRPCETVNRFSQIRELVDQGLGTVDTYEHFLTTLEAGGKLPSFCYLEPYWGGGIGVGDHDFVGVQGNDYHPPTWVGPAEFELNRLYSTLKKSRHWDSTLLIVTFDEHGGTWDHVSPTATVPPDDVSENGNGFGFDRLGVRVPTILVTPFVEAGTVFRATPKPRARQVDFDHTSTLATLLAWAGLDTADCLLGKRVMQAPTFEDALTSEPATDGPACFQVPAGYEDQGGGVGLHLLDVRNLDVGPHELRLAAADATSVGDLHANLARLSAKRRELSD